MKLNLSASGAVSAARPRAFLIYSTLKTETRSLSRVAWLALGAGFLLRLGQYLLDRSLWLDEAYLSLNILHRSFSGLLQPLDYHQGAPLGFLFVEKSALHFLGPGELSLRLLPLLAGLISLFLFFRVAKDILRPAAVPVALGLFAVAPPLIYYASEVKQYSSDVAIALLLYVIALGRKSEQWTSTRVLVFGAVGSLAVWFSHPSVFVLAGIGAMVVLSCMERRDWESLVRFSPAIAMWATSLLVCYLVLLRHLTGDQTLLNYWSSNFMPFPTRSLSDLNWFFDTFFGFFSGTAGLVMSGLAAFVFLIGVFYKWSTDRQQVSILLAPAALTLLASGLHKYPFGGRLALFLVPAIFLLMAEGIEQIRISLPNNSRAIAYALIGLLFLDPCIYLAHHFLKPYSLVRTPGIMLPEEIRPVFTYVHQHEQSGDVIYLFTDSQPAYEYYEEVDRVHDANVVMGTASGSHPEAYMADLDRLRGRRVWVVFSHFNGMDADEAKYVRFYLESLGKQLSEFSSPGAAVYLYDLSGAPASPAALSAKVR